MDNTYKCLRKQRYCLDKYCIVPIRLKDKYLIMQWRNEQIYHLRQSKPLTKEIQDLYFDDVVLELFRNEKPEQILFSYLENDRCIAYGGLVHINWIDLNAEISFVMNTALERLEFEKHWTNYLSLIEQVAFKELHIHKIYVYAFDLRPHLYQVLEKNKYSREATLKDHIFYNESFRDVVIHSKLQSK